MFRALFKLGLLAVAVVAVGGFLMGWWTTEQLDRGAIEERVGTAGAVVKERAGDAAVQAKNVLEDGALTAKIKSKITLDDTLEGISINIDTVARVTTLNGTVRSEAQRQRLLQLARETKGVTKVVDNLKVV
jgi:osmotically-inducible protein OsmY